MGTVLLYSLVSGFASAASASRPLQGFVLGAVVLLACFVSTAAGHPTRFVMAATAGSALLFAFGSAATVILHVGRATALDRRARSAIL